MTALGHALRALGIAGVIAALLDPGCATAERPVVDVLVLEGVTHGDALVSRLAESTPWAEVRRVPAPGAVASREVAAARVVVGDAGAVLAAVQEQRAGLAIRPPGEALEMAHLTVASEVAVGTRTWITATIADLPGRPGRARVRVFDAATKVPLAEDEAAVPAGATGSIVVRVPWIAVRPGPVRLRAVAEWIGEGVVRPSAPAEVDVRVRALPVEVDVLEARPSWSARFARLALEGMADVTVRSESRVAPGLVVGTDVPASAPATARVRITLVGGLEALTTADVTRLTTEVRNAGRTVILVSDDVPGPGPWTRLWPMAPVGARSSPTSVRARLGGHVWHVREWLVPTTATDARPLAYEDGGMPIVWGRADGAGRVVLVGALDAWRWRADADTDFQGGWRALVTSLVLDQRPPLSLHAWLGHASDGRVVELATTTTSAMEAEQVQVTTGGVLGDGAGGLRLEEASPGSWRARTPWPGVAPVPVTATALRAGRVVADDTAVIDVRPPAPVATWQDVTRHQASVGALAATADGAPAALSTLGAGVNAPPGARWHVTRTWWFAALVLAALGLEWILRRLHGER